MLLKICNKEIDTKEIRSIIIKEKEIMIDSDQEFIRLSYSTPEEIQEAKDWLRFQELTNKDIIEAANMIILVCDYYLNQYDQCEECPINRNYGCLTQNAPMNWRKQNVNRINETE